MRRDSEEEGEGDVPEEEFEMEGAEPDTKKLRVIIEELTFTIFKDQYATLFINSILKFLSVYDLQKLHSMLSSDMKQWWNRRKVWRQLCIINMKNGEFESIMEMFRVRHVLEEVGTGQPMTLNYKWLLIIWEIYAALTAPGGSNIEKMWITMSKKVRERRHPQIMMAVELSMREGILISKCVTKELNPFFTYFVGISGIPSSHLSKTDDKLHFVRGRDAYFALMYRFMQYRLYFKRQDFLKNNAGSTTYRYIRQNIK
jgi:hypothetical protein